jgi:thioesterase domain-containing protein/acyl carrier protein
MIPSFFQLVTAWTLTANGKIDRHALPIPHMDDVPSEQTTMPRDAIETRLMEIWQRVLGMRVSTQDNFFELGGHSLLIVKVQAQIQEKFNTQIPISTFFERPTIEELAKVLRERGWTPSHSSLVPIQPKGTLRPLFWVFPPEACFRLAKYLGLDQPLYGLRYDEEAAKKKNFSVTFEELAHCFIQEMKAVQPEGPYLLAGHSAGGMMAFEMARQLKSNGESIALLGLVDSYLKRLTPNPQVEKSLGYYFDRALFYWEKKKLREHLVLKIKEVKDRYITQIQNRLLRKKVLPVNPAWDAIVRAAMQYQPRPYSDRITLFSAVERYTWQTQDAESLCKPFAEGGLDVHRVPGDHVTLLQEPNFQVLAKQLKKCLDRAHSEG